MSARPWSAAALLGTGPGAGSQAAAASQLPLRVPAERAMPRSSRDPCTKPHSQDTAHTLNPRPKSKRGRAGPPNSQHCPQTSEPAPDSAAHPRQLFNATSEVCWINKYSRDTPGYVSFMSSLCYQKQHPLRGSDASITEIIFVMNNLFEKRVLIISRKNSKKKSSLACFARLQRWGGCCKARQEPWSPRSPREQGEVGWGRRGAATPATAALGGGQAVPCQRGVPGKHRRWLSKAHNYLKTTLKHTFSAKLQRLRGNQRAPRFPTGHLRQSCVAGVMFTQKMTTATTLGFF